jgi:hypothetical protein
LGAGIGEGGNESKSKSASNTVSGSCAVGGKSRLPNHPMRTRLDGLMATDGM